MTALPQTYGVHNGDAVPVEPDFNQAAAFLQWLDPMAQGFTFQTFDDNADRKSPSLVAKLHGTLDQHAGRLARLNQQGAGVFVTVNETDLKGREAKNITRVRAVFADTDGAPLEPIQGHLMKPSGITDSSPGKWHAYWLAEGLPLDEFEQIQSNIASMFGTDSKVKDLPRVMRLPGFYHRKAEPYLVTFKVQSPSAYSAEQVRRAFPAPEQSPPPVEVKAAAITASSGYYDMLADSPHPYATRARDSALAAIVSAPDGCRNDALNREAHGLFGLVKGGHLPEYDIRAALERAAIGAGLTQSETATTLASAWKAAQPRDIEDRPMNQPSREASQTTQSEQVEDEPFSLAKFSLNGQSEVMESKMLEDKYVLGKLAILGQSTAFYAKPNAGKTLMTIWLLIEQIKAGDITASDVFYVNADDNHKGLTFKLKLAEKWGFNMLAPGYSGFRSDQLAEYLAAMVHSDQAHGKVLILDTVKKFTDLMDKRKGSEFGESVRQFVSHGGTAIMLGHVNKHRDGEGEVIYSGTSDITDDCDCYYTLDTVSEDAKTGRVVKFKNGKNRGDVASEAVYCYDATDGKTYRERLDSIRPVDDSERDAVERQRTMNEQLERNREAVDAIRECLLVESEMKKTDLITAAHERSAIGKEKIRKALGQHTGKDLARHQFWHLDVRDKNAHVYRLNWGDKPEGGTH